MKIAYVSRSFLPSKDANSVHVVKMADAFSRLGHEVTLFGFEGQSEIDVPRYYGVETHFRIVTVRSPHVRKFGPVIGASRVWQKKSPYMFDLCITRCAVYAALFHPNNEPLIYESHWLNRRRRQELLERMVFHKRSFLTLVVISDALRQLYVSGRTMPHPSRIFVAHDAADAMQSRTKQSGIVVARAYEQKLSAVYAGSMKPERGIALILNLAKRLPDVHFHILGGTPREVLYWRTLADQLENIRFYGHVQHSQIASYLVGADVLLAPYQPQTPSIQWASPLKLFEYMACGRAIVASDFPVFREILSDGFNALLVQSDDIPAWEEALNALRDIEKRRFLGHNALISWRDRHTWIHRARNILEHASQFR